MKYLVAIDGSESSYCGVSEALKLFQKGDQVLLLCVAQHARRHAQYALQVDDEMAEGEHLRFAQGAVESALALCEDSTDAAVEGKVVYGDPRSKILEEAKQQGSDVIVVGFQGLGALKSLFLGSVSRYVANHAPCNVYVVKQRRAAQEESANPSCTSASQPQTLQEAGLGAEADSCATNSEHATSLPLNSCNEP